MSRVCTETGKQYTVVAGVNGAGKSTLYYASNAKGRESKFGVRLNADDAVRSLGLDWRSPAAQIAGGRQVLSRLNECLSAGESCNQETTLCGSAVMNAVRRAKGAGYAVNMLFVGVDSPAVAAERVAARVAIGGHGVDDETIAKRYPESLDNLKRIMPYCDNVWLYDNTRQLRCVAILQNGIVICDLTGLPGFSCSWAEGIIAECRRA